MDKSTEQDFQKELEERIAVLTDPSYDDISLKPLTKFDYTMIGLIIVVALLIMVWGWF